MLRWHPVLPTASQGTKANGSSDRHAQRGGLISSYFFGWAVGGKIPFSRKYIAAAP